MKAKTKKKSPVPTIHPIPAESYTPKKKSDRPVGRPSGFNHVKVTITKDMTADAVEENDIARAIKRALEQADLQADNIQVFTKDKMKASNPHLDVSNVPETIILEGNVMKFPWQLKNYRESFAYATKGSHDFTFFLKVPKEWGIS